MTPALALTLFVKTDNPESHRAREILQYVLPGLVEDVEVQVLDVANLEAAELGISISTAPVLRIQRGDDTLEWLVHFDRAALADRLHSLGVPLRSRDR